MEPSADLTLVDAFVPQLVAGRYVLAAAQTLRVETPDGAGAHIEKHGSKAFFVQGPRFALAADDVYSRFPAQGQSGPFHDTLPHVVFRRKALPWERRLDDSGGSDDKPPLPWLALLLFGEDELSRIVLATQSFDQVVQPPDGIRGPSITLDPWETDPENDDEARSCTVIDLPLALLRRLAPRPGELRWLAHARLAETRHKEDLYGIGDGWFSVILANRLPQDGNRNLAVLVSLEGQLDLIGDPAPDLPETMTVRLVVLDKWAFVSDGPTFEERIGQLYRGKDVWLRVAGGDQASDGRVGTALSLGYVPMPHRLRDGSRTLSWYRGPLVPVDVPAPAQPAVFAHPDEALRYDAATGLLDSSYAAAWQLGRLLALQNQEFARALFQVENGQVAAVLGAEAEQGFADYDANEPAPDQQARRIARLGQAARLHRDDLMAALALEWSL